MSEKEHLDEAGMVRMLFDRLSAGLYTTLPGVIVAFDATTCLATVQPAIRMKTVINGQAEYIDLPAVEHVPICLPHSAAGGLFVTVPIKAGDQCLLIFSQRGIDLVVDGGGIQNPPDSLAPAYSQLRHHDLTDAICIPNLMVLPTAITGWNAAAIEIRSADGLTKVSVASSEITVQKGATTLVVNDTGVQITGNVVVTGEVTANGIPLSTHIHTGGTIDGKTGVPST